MITRILTATIIAIGLIASPATTAQHETGKQEQSACPITGRGVNKKLFVDHEGKRLFLCCPSCKKKAAADADKIISRLQAEGITLANTSYEQTICPVMGGKINKELFSDHEGKRVYFCCAMCKPLFDKEPLKFIGQMEARGIELAKAEKKE